MRNRGASHGDRRACSEKGRKAFGLFKSDENSYTDENYGKRYRNVHKHCRKRGCCVFRPYFLVQVVLVAVFVRYAVEIRR